MKIYNSNFRLSIRHYGFPINNWGYEIKDSDNKIIKKDMQCGQYSVEKAIIAGKEEFDKIAKTEEY